MELVKYKVISNFLREQILNGFLKSGAQIPSELELAKMFNVSRMTARKGIEKLVSEGTLYQVSRLGTFVNDHANKIEVHLEDSFSFQRQQKDLHSIVDRFNVTTANKSFQQLFNLLETDTVYEFSRIRYKGDNVFAYEEGVIPTKYIHLSTDILNHSLTEYFEKSGLHIQKIQKEFLALTPNDEISKIFGLPRLSAVFCIEFSRYIQNNNLFAFIRVYYNQQYCKFVQIVEK